MRRAFALSNRNLTFPPASRRIVPTVMSNASRKRFAFPSMSGIRPIKPQSDVSACKQAIRPYGNVTGIPARRACRDVGHSPCQAAIW